MYQLNIGRIKYCYCTRKKSVKHRNLELDSHNDSRTILFSHGVFREDIQSKLSVPYLDAQNQATRKEVFLFSFFAQMHVRNKVGSMNGPCCHQAFFFTTYLLVNSQQKLFNELKKASFQLYLRVKMILCFNYK